LDVNIKRGQVLSYLKYLMYMCFVALYDALLTAKSDIIVNL